MTKGVRYTEEFKRDASSRHISYYFRLGLCVVS